MKRLLLIDDNYHTPHQGSPFISAELEFLEQEGYEVYTLSFDANPPHVDDKKDFIINAGLSPLSQKIAKFAGSAAIEKQVRKVIDHVKPDIIHNHLISKYPLSVFNALRQDIPILQTLHGPNFFCPTSWGNMKKDSSPCDLGLSFKCVSGGCVPVWQYPAMHSMFPPMLKLLKKVSVFHCPSRNIERIAHHFGFKNTAYVPSGLRDFFIDLPKKRHFDGNKILFIGTLHPVKGLDYLFEAMRIIADRKPDVKLFVSGKGPHENIYKEKVSALKIEKNVDFLGFVDTSRLTDLFQSADISVVPSVWSEQFGMVGPESLACGIPVVGSNVGGIPEWLKDNEHGFLVPPRDSRLLAEKILHLLADKELLMEFSEKGYAFANKVHSDKEFKNNFMELIRKTQK